jgi:hypothetical protein
MTVVLGLMALAVDLSQMGAYRSELQRAADAGAHAGAIQLTKARYDSAAAIASSFTAANVVFGKAPTIDAVEYGTWNNTASTFTLICAGLACDSTTVKSANAIRVSVHGAGSTIFAGILGALGFSVQTKAIGWAAPVAGTDCLKPITLPYTALTLALNSRLGLSAATVAGDTLRDLTEADLAVIRDDPGSLSLCLRQGLPGIPCLSTESVARLLGNFQPLLLSGLFDNDLSSGCIPAAPPDVLQVLNLSLPIVGNLLSANQNWCDISGGNPCAIKVALWDNITSSGITASVRIRMIGSIVVDGANPLTLNISAHFSNSIDTGPIGTGSGMLYRPVLVQ